MDKVLGKLGFMIWMILWRWRRECEWGFGNVIFIEVKGTVGIRGCMYEDDKVRDMILVPFY
jgi:hypothetical protein